MSEVDLNHWKHKCGRTLWQSKWTFYHKRFPNKTYSTHILSKSGWLQFLPCHSNVNPIVKTLLKRSELNCNESWTTETARLPEFLPKFGKSLKLLYISPGQLL